MCPPSVSEVNLEVMVSPDLKRLLHTGSLCFYQRIDRSACSQELWILVDQTSRDRRLLDSFRGPNDGGPIVQFVTGMMRCFSPAAAFLVRFSPTLLRWRAPQPHDRASPHCKRAPVLSRFPVCRDIAPR